MFILVSSLFSIKFAFSLFTKKQVLQSNIEVGGVVSNFQSFKIIFSLETML